MVRRMARSDHWRWVSTPRWARTSWKVTSTCQRATNQAMIWAGDTVGSVLSRACGSNWPLGIAQQHPAQRDGRRAGAVPEGGAGRHLDLGGPAAVPGDGQRLPDRGPDRAGASPTSAGARL